MTLHQDLLEQAEHLAKKEPKRPKQASLRRAVSAAYYALFHLLASEGAQVLAPSQPSGLRLKVQRAFGHGDMSKVCRGFAYGNVNKLSDEIQALIGTPFEPELASVARAFVALQQARHNADYDVATPLSKSDVLQKIDMARNAFADWGQIRTSPNAKVFLAALLLQSRWSR